MRHEHNPLGLPSTLKLSSLLTYAATNRRKHEYLTPARQDRVQQRDRCASLCAAMISLLAARVLSQSRSTGQWELHVLGKNGVTLHGTLLTPENPPHPLRSQDMIQIAEKQFHFLLPKDPQW